MSDEPTQMLPATVPVNPLYATATDPATPARPRNAAFRTPSPVRPPTPLSNHGLPFNFNNYKSPEYIEIPSPIQFPRSVVKRKLFQDSPERINSDYIDILVPANDGKLTYGVGWFNEDKYNLDKLLAQKENSPPDNIVFELSDDVEPPKKRKRVDSPRNRKELVVDEWESKLSFPFDFPPDAKLPINEYVDFYDTSKDAPVIDPDDERKNVMERDLSGGALIKHRIREIERMTGVKSVAARRAFNEVALKAWLDA